MITILDYGIGNVSSIQNMFKKIGVPSLISKRVEDIADSSKLILPGMGAFDNCMTLFEVSGLRDIVMKKALVEKVPVLGICVGLQMLMESSEEGSLPGLGWVDGKTVKFDEKLMSAAVKVPNMGWLEVLPKKSSKLLENLENARFYHAHSYHIKVANPEAALVTSDYGYEFVSGIEIDNIMGVQFHPEKSHRFGMQLLKNFAEKY